MRRAIFHANRHPHVHIHADHYGNADAHPDAYADAHGHCYTDSNGHPHRDFEPERDAHGNIDPPSPTTRTVTACAGACRPCLQVSAVARAPPE